MSRHEEKVVEKISFVDKIKGFITGNISKKITNNIILFDYLIFPSLL
jgi:hypothetical protein